MMLTPAMGQGGVPVYPLPVLNYLEDLHDRADNILERLYVLLDAVTVLERRVRRLAAPAPGGQDFLAAGYASHPILSSAFPSLDSVRRGLAPDGPESTEFRQTGRGSCLPTLCREPVAPRGPGPGLLLPRIGVAVFSEETVNLPLLLGVYQVQIDGDENAPAKIQTGIQKDEDTGSSSEVYP
jgi:hypothetical protein